MGDLAVIRPVEPVAPDRSTFIGGSDVASILRVSPWTSPVQLYYKKVDPSPEDRVSGVKKRGIRWESVVAEMLVESLETTRIDGKDGGHKVEIVRANQRYTDPECEHFRCEIDYEIRLDGAEEITNVELKTVHPNAAGDWGKSGTEGVPVWYTTQAMWGLGITGRQTCLVAPLFGADSLSVFLVQRDENLIAWMRDEAMKFWHDHVLARKPPTPLTSADLALLFPKGREGAIVFADDTLKDQILELREVSANLAALEARWDLLEFRVKQAMGDAEVVSFGDQPAVVWKERGGAHLDQEGLKVAHPDISRKFMKKTSSRVFTVKNFKWGKK